MQPGVAPGRPRHRPLASLRSGSRGTAGRPGRALRAAPYGPGIPGSGDGRGYTRGNPSQVWRAASLRDQRLPGLRSQEPRRPAPRFAAAAQRRPVGPGRRPLSDRKRARSPGAGTGSGRTVVCTGFAPDDDLAALYSAAAVFAFPSLSEGFGLPVLEAMGCGTPVVASTASAVPEAVGEPPACSPTCATRKPSPTPSPRSSKTVPCGPGSGRWVWQGRRHSPGNAAPSRPLPSTRSSCKWGKRLATMTTPVRILHVVIEMAPSGGGVSTWLRDVLRHIDREQFRMDFLVHTDQPQAFDDEVRGLGSRILPCTRPSGCGNTPATFSGSCVRTGRTTSSIATPSSAATSSGWPAGQGFPCHRDSHSDRAGFGVDGELLRGLFIRWTNRWLGRHATHGLACSRRAAAALFGPDWEHDPRWRLHYYGLDFTPFRAPADRDRLRAGAWRPRRRHRPGTRRPLSEAEEPCLPARGRRRGRPAPAEPATAAGGRRPTSSRHRTPRGSARHRPAHHLGWLPPRCPGTAASRHGRARLSLLLRGPASCRTGSAGGRLAVCGVRRDHRGDGCRAGAGSPPLARPVCRVLGNAVLAHATPRRESPGQMRLPR